MKTKNMPTPNDVFCERCMDLSLAPAFKASLMSIRGFTTHSQVALWYHRNNHQVFER